MQTSTLEITLLSPVTVATVSPLFTAYRLRFPPVFSWYDKFERVFQLIYVCTQRSELETPSKEVSFALYNGKGSGKLSKIGRKKEKTQLCVDRKSKYVLFSAIQRFIYGKSHTTAVTKAREKCSENLRPQRHEKEKYLLHSTAGIV